MGMNWVVAFSGLIGAIIGGAVSLLTTRLSRLRESNP